LNSVELSIKTGEIIVSPVISPECTHVNVNMPEILQINLDCGESDIEVSHVSEPKYRKELKRFVREYEPRKMREIDFKMSIILKDDEPVYQRARRLAMPERELVNAQMNEWMRSGVIQPSLSNYASPIILVKKKTVLQEYM